MSRLAGAFLLLCLHAGYVYGMDCTLGGSSNIVEKLTNSCPGIFDNSYKSYCCYDISRNRNYCCDVEEFMVKTGLGFILPVIITLAVVITLIVCCISCLCCSCCPWYRRRHRGTVYGIFVTEDQVPNVVHVVQTPASVLPNYTSQGNQVQNHHVPYATNSAGFPQYQPPQYTNEAYAKQAPYNPAYPPQ